MAKTVRLPKRRFRDFNLPFVDFYENEQTILKDTLIRAGISKSQAKDVLDSGFYMTEDNGYVYDSYYAPSWANEGNFTLENFLKFLNNTQLSHSSRKKISVIRSLNEMVQILKADSHSNHALENGSLSFRGQTKEHVIKRAVPNPTLADPQGFEQLMIPSIYRKYRDDFQQRIIDEKPHEVFSSLVADDLIYYGMGDLKELSKSNFDKYGFHTISDLEDFPEPINQEYYKRWSQIKVQGTRYPDIAIISQHYGLHTYGLDITFDPSVAGFFASHEFYPKDNGKADFRMVKSGNHKGVIYCFYFRAPQITRTSDIIKKIPAFDYIHPSRPINQACALPFFHSLRFNDASQFIWHIFKLAPDFEMDEQPTKEFLFPSAEEDKFYQACLEVKKRNPMWSEFVEYEFD